MCKFWLSYCVLVQLFLSTVSSYKYENCGLYGFTCIGKTRLRLCDNSLFYGPTFVCPESTVCNDNSRKVCEDSATYVNPTLLKNGKFSCKRNQRMPDPSINGCKGYILCVQNKNKLYDVVKFKCTGNTVFNPNTKTCSAPTRYKCPENSTAVSLFVEDRHSEMTIPELKFKHKSIDCKNYRLSVDESSRRQSKVAFFCPRNHPFGLIAMKCTVFSNNFCVQLEKEDEEPSYQSKRKPRDLNIANVLK